MVVVAAFGSYPRPRGGVSRRRRTVDPVSIRCVCTVQLPVPASDRTPSVHHVRDSNSKQVGIPTRTTLKGCRLHARPARRNKGSNHCLRHCVLFLPLCGPSFFLHRAAMASRLWHGHHPGRGYVSPGPGTRVLLERVRRRGPALPRVPCVHAQEIGVGKRAHTRTEGAARGSLGLIAPP